MSVAVTYAQTGDTLSVPFRAVTTTNGTSTVEVSNGSSTETRTVTTGLTVGGMVQITDGLSAGDQVVVRGPGGGRTTTQGSGTGTEPGGTGQGATRTPTGAGS